MSNVWVLDKNRLAELDSGHGDPGKTPFADLINMGTVAEQFQTTI